MKEVRKKRQSNFELLRIVSMLMIVLWHIIIHGQVGANASGTLHLITRILLAICVVHVNSLVLLTGYFSCEKESRKMGKVFAIMSQAWFYKVVIILLFSFLGLETVSKVTLLEELLPLDVRDYWFVNCYLVILILSPFFNILIKNMNQKKYRTFLLISFLLFSIVPYATMNRTILNDGYSIIQFTFLYFLGGYLKRYPVRENMHFKQYSISKRRLIFFTLFFGFAFFNLILTNFGQELGRYDNPIVQFFGNIITFSSLSYANPLVILQTISYFLFFETLDIKKRCINWVAASTFGVYLIHDNVYVRGWIYKALNITKDHPIYGVKYVFVLLFYTFFIFACCLLIEKVRQFIAGIIKRRKWYLRMKTKISDSIANF